ncbi:hydantoinase/oxoprolinase family protein [Natronomonas halophila]|uniref:hydantoinase/oxoprolinase family protein n=1 Tax=Natronomonas halophila TaxID=2747817 RepID=UPI0015B6D175|nr:hydantoinase/oxoprolinase family protein [Natronomonas halophila]QLD84570.1 hydantoinase/oxoprolinase family protein [Natronomonas halophila]
MVATPHVSVDVGGTFTDVVLTTDSDLVTAKVPSTADQSEGVLEGIRKACDRAGIAPDEVATFTHAMTVSVNALLERNGAETALVTTDGFRDVLEIGRQTRPALYDLDAERTPPLVPRRRRYGLDERATTKGIEMPVDPAEVDALAEELADAESIAVSLLHAYNDSENEAIVADRLRKALDVPVSVSHEVLPAFREYERTSTTVVDAYVRPAIDSYLGRLTERATEAGIPAPRVMQSNGGIADPETVRKRAVTTVLSGPAAGVVGAKASAERAVDGEAFDGVVTFDMGGTSSDVSLVRDGEIARTTDAEIDGLPIAMPMVDVNTVGSGGGSIAWVDAGGALRVGPESAGADPGPACYGSGGGKPTVTDANVVLGYIGADAALGGEVSLDVEAARDVLAELADEAGLDSAQEAAEGVYRVANANMTRAIRSVTIERGYDPREFGLVAFGGAGPMHATALAERLEMDRVIVPLAGGVLSAYGLLGADEQHDAMHTHRTLLDEADPSELEAIYDALTTEARADVTADEEPTIERIAELRYDGQSFELGVPVDEPLAIDEVRERFNAAHERAYGYRMDEPVELVALRVSARVEHDVPTTGYEGAPDANLGTRTAVFDGERHELPVFARSGVTPGTTIDGPAVLEDDESTVVVRPGWSGTVQPDGALVLEGGGR